MKAIGLTLLTVLPLCSLPAAADTEVPPPRATVFFGDLDLRTGPGADALRRRIDRAVTAISGDQVPTGTLIPSPDIDDARVRGREQAEALIAAARRNGNRN